jgi:hypothetical protein
MTTAIIDYSLELEVEAEVSPGLPAITGGRPEDCREGEPPTVEISEVWILRSDGSRSQKLHGVCPALLDLLADAVIEQYREDRAREAEGGQL